MEIALSRGQQLPGEGIAAVWGGGDVACEIFIDEEAIHVPDGPLSARIPSPGRLSIHEFLDALRSS